MTPEQFCYWLQGFREINNGQPPTVTQWVVIRDHLDLVFDKRTPFYPVGTPPSVPILDKVVC